MPGMSRIGHKCRGWLFWKVAAWAVTVSLAFFARPGAAHTLPISYLRLVPEADYLHLELIFNPFELALMSEVDDNKDAELDLGELARHGQVVADAVVGALKLRAGGAVLRPETAGMDPDLSGHHVRLRAHYKVDARGLPLTIESDLPALTSLSHLTQVTYDNGTNRQLAQFDSHSRRVTFQPPVPLTSAVAPAVSRGRAAASVALLALVAFLLVIAGAARGWCWRRRRARR